MKRDELAGPWNLLNDLIADHPMWIGDDGQPLDYLPEREARIGDFIAAASDALTRMLADAWDEGHRAPQKLGRDGCKCFAYSAGECACGKYGTVVVTPNPYRTHQLDATEQWENR